MYIVVQALFYGYAVGTKARQVYFGALELATGTAASSWRATSSRWSCFGTAVAVQGGPFWAGLRLKSGGDGLAQRCGPLEDVSALAFLAVYGGNL